MGIGVTGGGGADAGVCADEDADKVGFQDVGQGWEVRVGGGRGVFAAGFAAAFGGWCWV